MAVLLLCVPVHRSRPRFVRSDLDDTNGIQGLDERRDVLRLESLILLVQLHLRKALQARAAARRALVLWKLCCWQHACLVCLQTLSLPPADWEENKMRS